MRRALGFTLLEMLVALAIAAGAAAIVLPRLRGSPAVEVTQAGRMLAAALRRTRGEAILGGRERVLELDVDRRRFRAAGDVRERRLPPAVAVELLTARSELTGSGQGAIRFFPDGSSTGGRVTVSAGSERLLVDVAWLTGRVRVLDAAGTER